MSPDGLQDRLERLRVETGSPTLKDFRKELTRHAPGRTPGYKISYAGMRNYHSDGREPPVSYLQRILEVFPRVRPEWLVSGTGEMTQEHADREAISEKTPKKTLRLRDAVLQSVGRASVPEVDALRPIPPWLGQLADVRSRLWIYDLTQSPGKVLADFRSGDVSAETVIEATIGAALRGPLEALGVHPDEMSDERFSDYITGMIPTLLALVAERSRQRRESVGRDAEEITEETDDV